MQIGILAANVGGGGGIRTHETVARLPVFKTGAFNHSATPPKAERSTKSTRLRVYPLLAAPWFAIQAHLLAANAPQNNPKNESSSDFRQLN